MIYLDAVTAKALLQKAAARNPTLAAALAEYERDHEKKGSNRGNRFVRTDEGLFRSEGEYERWCQLKIEHRTGEITELEKQIPYDCRVNDIHVCYWIADFRYRRAGALVVEDFKGYEDALFRLKKKLVEAVFGFEIHLTGARRKVRTYSKKVARR